VPNGAYSCIFKHTTFFNLNIGNLIELSMPWRTM